MSEQGTKQRTGSAACPCGVHRADFVKLGEMVTSCSRQALLGVVKKYSTLQKSRLPSKLSLTVRDPLWNYDYISRHVYICGPAIHYKHR
jgi:hypothetical protein